jgi:septum site-determining protein MinC
MNNTIQTPAQTAFLLKASSLTFTVFQLTKCDLNQVKAQLETMVEHTPNFFNATPAIIDLSNFDHTNTEIDLAGLITLLKSFKLSPLGVRTLDTAYIATANANSFPVINGLTTKAKENSPKSTATSALPTMIVDQPVRSGKQVYAKNCDLIVTSTVSNGAEILADGNIHIYGSLKGRALAGVQGNEAARIYCRDIQAELVAIAGNYLVNEQIPEAYKGSKELVEVSLVAHSLRFNKFSS